MSEPAALYEAIEAEVSTVLVGHDELVEQITVALLSRGHVLLEGVPGVAKTTLANVFARASGLAYNRIQMTPDLLPADITGTTVYRSGTGEFELQKGPVFANVVVADEINRATPKTQSALLEAMEESAVTIEGETLALPTRSSSSRRRTPSRWRDLRTPGGPARPLHVEANRRHPRPRRRAPDHRPLRRPAESQRRRRRDRSSREKTSSAPARRLPRSTSPTASASTSSTSSSPRGPTRTSNTGRRSAPPSPCCTRPRPARRSTAASTSSPTT